jgi:hypothetical protein
MNENQNNNQNANWNFDVNLSGLRAATGVGSTLAEGFYKATITDAYILTDKPGRVIMKLTISEGESTGMIRTTGLGVPKNEQDGVRYYWRAVLESAGYTPAQIDAGAVGMNRNLLVGRTVAIYYKPGDKDAGIYEELNFFPPADWDRKAAAFAQKAGSPAAPVMSMGATPAMGAALTQALGSAIGVGMAPPTVTVAPPSNGIGGVGAGDLMAALGKR